MDDYDDGFLRFYGAFPDFEAEGQPVAVWATTNLSMASIKKAAKGLVAKYKAALDVAYIRSGHYPISAKDALYERERGLQDVVRLQMSRDAELSPFLCEQAFNAALENYFLDRHSQICPKLPRGRKLEICTSEKGCLADSEERFAWIRTQRLHPHEAMVLYDLLQTEDIFLGGHDQEFKFGCAGAFSAELKSQMKA